MSPGMVMDACGTVDLVSSSAWFIATGPLDNNCPADMWMEPIILPQSIQTGIIFEMVQEYLLS